MSPIQQSTWMPASSQRWARTVAFAHVPEADVQEADVPEADVPEADVPEADVPEPGLQVAI